MCYYFSP